METNKIVDDFIATLVVEDKPKRGHNRCKSYYRHHRKRVIRKKSAIVSSLQGVAISYVRLDRAGKGIFAKGKIHCSCNLCAAKTSKNGWKISDLRKMFESSET
jgi:hypothetical protein